LARPNITINGLDIPQSQDAKAEKERREESVQYEPYDPTLALKLSALYSNLESLTTSVSSLRRTAPKTAAQNYSRELQQSIEEDELRFREIAEKDREKGKRGDREVLELKRPERWGEVRGRFDVGVEEMKGLGTLGETVGRAERARGVVEGL
jgi:hypothetical protein